MKDYKYAVYIGRFQPFHNGHLQVIRNGLEIAEEMIVVVGSIGAAPNTRNPWSFEERKRMIMGSLLGVNADEKNVNSTRESLRTHVVGVRDYFYNENTWITDIQAQVDAITQGSDAVALLGSYKDSSSYYLKYFPDWDFVPTQTTADNSTEIRERLFRESLGQDWEARVPESHRGEIVALAKSMPVPAPVGDFLGEFVQTPAYVSMCAEHKFVVGYKDSWASAPFPPIFVTTDAVVVCSGHVLVVERKFNPGKGLYALPGGFVKEKQKIEDSMLRELKEETRIDVDKLILQSSVVASRVFDHPERSQRGRTITHGYYIKLKDGKLPKVRPDDDAKRAFWMPLMDVMKNERRFFEDHVHIINYFAGLS